MKIKVPKSVDVEELLCNLELTPTRRENFSTRIKYFLSLLVVTNENYKLFEETEGYRRISSVKMKNILSSKDYYQILSLLTDPQDPKVISNGSYRSSNSGSEKGFCMGYRLTPKYNNQGFKYEKIPDKMHRKIQKCFEESDDFDNSKYEFLYQQFTAHTLNFDPSVYDYIRNFGESLLSKVQNEYQEKMVFNLIGRWLRWVKDIENKKFWPKVSPNNHRLNSRITHLKRTLRPFLLCDGRSLSMIDISASQPYILAAILNNEFLSTNTSGFNLYSIYPKIYKILCPGYCMKDTGASNRPFEYFSLSGASIDNVQGPSSGSGGEINKKEYSFMWGEFSAGAGDSKRFDSYSNSGNSINNMQGPVSRTGGEDIKTPYSFMWGRFSDTEIQSIRKYQTSPFEDDFYRYVLSLYKDTTEISDEERQEFKHNMMLVFFDDNKVRRNNIPYIKVFKKIFPGVDKWITTLHKKIGNDKLSYLLQRTESHLMLNKVCREFNSKFPEAPLYTIHDAALTFPEYLPDLQKLILGHFYETTGIKVGLKSSFLEPSILPRTEDIEEEWEDIKKIKNLDNFNKLNYHVLTSNVRRGAEFMKKQPSDNTKK